MSDVREISSGDARKTFADQIAAAQHGAVRVIVTKNGKQAAAIVPIDDLRLLEELEDILDVEEAKRAIEEARREGTTTLEELIDELGF